MGEGTVRRGGREYGGHGTPRHRARMARRLASEAVKVEALIVETARARARARLRGWRGWAQRRLARSAKVRGVRLSKQIMQIAGDALKRNITNLGPLVLPLSEQLRFFWFAFDCKASASLIALPLHVVHTAKVVAKSMDEHPELRESRSMQSNIC